MDSASRSESNSGCEDALEIINYSITTDDLDSGSEDENWMEKVANIMGSVDVRKKKVNSDDLLVGESVGIFEKGTVNKSGSEDGEMRRRKKSEIDDSESDDASENESDIGSDRVSEQESEVEPETDTHMNIQETSDRHLLNDEDKKIVGNGAGNESGSGDEEEPRNENGDTICCLAKAIVDSGKITESFSKTITDLIDELSKRNSEMSEHKKTAMKISTDFELEIGQLNLKIENMEQQNVNDNIIWREMDTENLKLKEEVKVSKYMLEQQQDLIESLMSRKSLSSCSVGTQITTAKTEFSESTCDKKTEQMLRIFEEDNSKLSSKNRELRVRTKVLEEDVVDLENKKVQLSEQLEETENTLKLFKTEKEEYRVKSKNLNEILIHRVEDIKRLKTYSETLADKNTELELEINELDNIYDTQANKIRDLQKKIKLELKSQRKKFMQYTNLGRMVADLGTKINGLSNLEENDSDGSGSASDEPQSKRSRTR